MANKTINMLQIQRIIQLLIKGEKLSSIAKELKLSLNTVKRYRSLFDSCGLTYNQLLELSQESLFLVVNPKTKCVADARLEHLSGLLPGFIKRLNSTHITRELLWKEYLESKPDGYSYSQFCEHLSRYMLPLKAVMHIEHKPADVLQIDFAGDHLEYVDKSTGEVISCPVLVCTLPYSSYCYVEVLADMSQANLIKGLNNCLFYLGGVPYHLCSDNLKQVVNKADKYEPKFSELMDQFALHYNISLLATRVRKPKDKASVERHVGIAYTRIYAIVEQQEHYSLKHLNESVRKYLNILNRSDMQRKELNRQQGFEKYEKPLLGPLPQEPFELKHQAMAKVNKDYHVILGEDWHNYSVPYQYIGQKMKLIYNAETVEIYKDTKRVAIHPRNYVKNKYSTNPEHMPKNHQISKQIGGYTPEYFMGQAEKIGPFALQVIKQVLESKFFTQQTFKSCLGILTLKRKYGEERLEKACEMTMNSFKINYHTVKTILENNRDKFQNSTETQATSDTHSNIRGADFYRKLFSDLNSN